MIRALVLVGMGGALGSMARYLCQRWMAEYYPHAFPFGTFVVNLSGCLLIGLFWSLTLKGGGQLDTWKLFLMTGICGGFTTFSAFTLESIGLLRENRMGFFLLYVLGSVTLGILATFAGMKLGRLFTP